MLGMKQYPKPYIAACRDRVEADLAAYRKGAKGAPKEFETRFFNAEVMLLDYMFVHRLTGQEGKDGNALNEVRVLANSLLLNNGKLQVEKKPGWPMSAPSGIKLDPAKSLLGMKPGDPVQVSEAGFAKLYKSFFQEIEKRFG